MPSPYMIRHKPASSLVRRLVAAACLLVLAGSAPPAAMAQAQDGDRVLMAVFAHPDDEGVVGPMLARYAREGVRVILVTTTDGRLGANEHSGLPPGDELAAVRRGEMQCAASNLGAELIHLEYHDQFNAAEGYDGFTPQLQGLIRDLHDLIREHEPDAIVTWGPDGFSNHMDHRLTGSSVTQVILSQEWEDRPDVYYFGLPASRVPEEDRVLRGVQEEHLTMRVPFTNEDLETAIRAAQCHESQMPAEGAEQMIRGIFAGENVSYLRPLVLPTPRADNLFN